MKLVEPKRIAQIDAFAVSSLGVSEQVLILRAGAAIADVICERIEDRAARILIFCGGGNNGADGYAAALSLAERGYRPLAVDIFAKGQRSEGGRAVLARYTALCGAPLTVAEAVAQEADVLVDAMFGTGFAGEWPQEGRTVARYMNRARAWCLAVDVPFGVDASFGSAHADALRADDTVVLSFMKKGLLSYPAREYCGRLLLKDIGLDIPAVHAAFSPWDEAIDDAYVRAHLPRRPANSHKGSFGKAVLIAGSRKYRGAAQLALLGALRCGVGLLTLISEECVTRPLSRKLPEVIYQSVPPMQAWSQEDLEAVLASTEGASAVLIGPGCGNTPMLGKLIRALLETAGAPLVLDADAINALGDLEEREALLKNACRFVLLTPHPLEFSRLSGMAVAEIQQNRMRAACQFAQKTHAALLLKGAGTVIADADGVSVNPSGSSALAKGGSGDVLAGAVTAFAAQGATAKEALALAAFLHGKAAEALAEEFSDYGVLVSDLPRAMAKEIRRILKEEEKVASLPQKHL